MRLSALEHPFEDLLHLLHVGIFERINEHPLLLGWISIELRDHFGDLRHQLAGGADHDGSCSLVGHREDAALFLQTVTGVCLSVVGCRERAAKTSSTKSTNSAAPEGELLILIFGFCVVREQAREQIGEFDWICIGQMEHP